MFRLRKSHEAILRNWSRKPYKLEVLYSCGTMNRRMPRQSFLDGPDFTWTDILRQRSNRAQVNSIESKLAATTDPLERTLLKSELELLREDSHDDEMI